MALTPPENRVWWKEPVAKVELIWVIVAFLWGLTMFFMMVYWHAAGKQNISGEAYRIEPAAFQKLAEDTVGKYKVGERAGVPVVRPPAGTDIYLIARLWQWWPIYELEQGKTYRLHISSLDWLHGFSLQPININLEIHPGYDFVQTVTPQDKGEFTIVCNEYCGIGHHTMTGKILVVDAQK